MDLRYDADELAFRDELRDWLAATLPTLPDEPDRDAPPEQQPPEPRWYKPHTWFSPRKEAPKAAEVPPMP